MKLILLKTFATIGFNFKINENGDIEAYDNNKNELKEGVDYIVEEKDKINPLSIQMANGLTVYAPPQ